MHSVLNETFASFVYFNKYTCSTYPPNRICPILFECFATITNDASTSLAYLLGTNIDVYAFELDRWGIYQFEIEPMAKRHITNTNQ